MTVESVIESAEKIPWGIPVAALCVLLFAAGCGDDAPEVTRARGAPAATYVGREACARCHQEEVEAWKGSHHDLAMQVADETTVLGNFDGSSFEWFGVSTTFSHGDGRFMVRSNKKKMSGAKIIKTYC